MPSPVIETKLEFPKAMEAIIVGKKISRLSWGNKDIYGLLKNGLLMIHRDDEFYKWIVNDGDLMGTDWVVV